MVVVQLTCTLVTLAVAVPAPSATRQVCDGLAGWVITETVYAVPLETAVAKVKLPFALTASVAPLFPRTSPVPERPEIVPPIV